MKLECQRLESLGLDVGNELTLNLFSRKRVLLMEQQTEKKKNSKYSFN